MRLPYAEPDPAGCERARNARTYRELAAEVSRTTPQASTRTNGEETDHGTDRDGKGDPLRVSYPANFTKGLAHDGFGLLVDAEDYRCFVEAINSPASTLFEKHVPTAATHEIKYTCGSKETCRGEKRVEWRGWESPRAGHVYELQGLDAGAVGMAPAPRVGSSELAAEMAEVYGLALLRDVPFSVICEGGGTQLCPGCEPTEAVLPASEVVRLLNEMRFFSGHDIRSSTRHQTDASGLNRFERNRREARTFGDPLTTINAFRGSTKGAQAGPYISQFMLIGAASLACAGDGCDDYPGREASFDLTDGFIPYGSLIIDQRTLTHKNCLDYMTDWCSWLDVQNGANFKGADKFETERRFITTPRDLATYVHFDALYEAYLNACLIMLGMGVPASKGFPEVSPSRNRDAFATFGGPHILSLVTEVATRCLKAVRRQKFSYHRRARPETIAGRLTLSALDLGGELGCAKQAFHDTLHEIPDALREAIAKHNSLQNGLADMRGLKCTGECYPGKTTPDRFHQYNLLLAMAFPEGSPMHPAYGAGHATVAGGCVTMLKAFFEMFEDCDSFTERPLCDAAGDPIAYEPCDDGRRLEPSKKFPGKLTIQGELDKLAANISIGRNMAGVHYYSDYYDSLRMGERVAVGILMEQAPTYGESVETTFKSFDGDYVTLTGDGGSCPTLSILDRHGNPIATRDWWLRHVSGEEIVEDR